MNEQRYVYSEQFMADLTAQAKEYFEKTMGVVSECVKSLQMIFKVDEVPVVTTQEYVSFDAIVKSEEGEVVLRTGWNLTSSSVFLAVIRVADGALLGMANLKLIGNDFHETYASFKDADLKAKVRTWFDALSRINLEDISAGKAEATAEASVPVPESPVATTEVPSEVPHVEAEIVSEG